MNALDLAQGDETGMWQLNYPFPYDSAAVGEQFAAYREALSHALEAPESASDAAVPAWQASRARLKEALADEDYRYLSFQLWQEGVARYTEYAVAREAIRSHRSLPQFEALEDSVSYQDAYAEMMSALRKELAQARLASTRRVVVYPVGAAEALLLDRLGVNWKADYVSAPFSLDPALTRLFSQ